MENKHVIEKNLKTINGQSILGEGNIEIVSEAIVDQNIDASTLTPEQLDYLRDKQIKYGMWTVEQVAINLTVNQTKLPMFYTKNIGNLESNDKYSFLCKAGKIYEISYSILAVMSAVGQYNFAIFDDIKDSAILITAISDYAGPTTNTQYRSNMDTYIVKFDIDTPISIRPSFTSGNITTMFASSVSIKEISSFDVSLKNFKINGKSFDENNNIDLEGLSNLSSPKVGEEVLTEERHSVSGKPIYKKVINFGSLPNATTKSVAHGITGVDFIMIDFSNSFMITPGVPDVSFSGMVVWGSVDSVGAYLSSGNILVYAGNNRTNMNGYFTLKYTKTTDTAESPVRLVGGKDVFDTMKDRGFEGSYEDFLIEMKGPEGNSVIDSAMLKLESSIEVTVGGGGDYQTINGALEFLSKNYYPVYKLHGVTATIRLLAGFIMQEQVFVRGLDLSWITIVGNDESTLVDNTSLAMDFSSSDYGIAAMPLFGISKGGYGPIINQRFIFDVLKPTGNKHGLMTIGAGSSAEILNGKGFIGAGNCGIYADFGSTILANGAVFNTSRVSGAYAANNSSIVANDTYVNDCGVNGIYATNNSNVTANNVNANNAGSRAIHSANNSRIMATSASAVNSGSNAIYAVNCSVISANGINATGCKYDGVYAIQGSEISIASGTVNSFTRYGVIANQFSKINATGVIIQNQTVGNHRFAVFLGSTILANAINVTGGTVAVLNQTANTLTSNGIIYQ